MTPPLWTRRLFPWRLLHFINRHTATCISGIVMWKLGYEGWSWWPHGECFSGPRGAEWDYCNRWETRESFEGATGVKVREFPA